MNWQCSDNSPYRQIKVPTKFSHYTVYHTMGPFVLPQQLLSLGSSIYTLTGRDCLLRPQFSANKQPGLSFRIQQRKVTTHASTHVNNVEAHSEVTRRISAAGSLVCLHNCLLSCSRFLCSSFPSLDISVFTQHTETC